MLLLIKIVALYAITKMCIMFITKIFDILATRAGSSCNIRIKYAIKYILIKTCKYYYSEKKYITNILERNLDAVGQIFNERQLENLMRIPKREILEPN